MFILIPHIVRESVLTRLNTRAIDTGTLNDIEVRSVDTPVDDFPGERDCRRRLRRHTTAANAAAAMVQQMKEQAMPPTPGAPARPASADAAAAAAARAISGACRSRWR